MGNWINKEWNQHVNLNSDDESNKENSVAAAEGEGASGKCKAGRTVRRRVSHLILQAHNSAIQYTRVGSLVGDSTPISDAKRSAAASLDLIDPRSPSRDIVR